MNKLYRIIFQAKVDDFSDFARWFALNALEPVESYHLKHIPSNETEFYPVIEKVPPGKIRYYSTLKDSSLPTIDDKLANSDINSVFVGELNGLWDYFRMPWEHSLIYRSLNQRIIENKDWENTLLYKFRDHYGRTGDEFRIECRGYDRLITSIRKDGYLSQKELRKHSNKKSKAHNINGEAYPDEPRVAVSRNNRLISVGGGSHRISIAKILDVPKIPVIKVLIHPKSVE